MPTEAYDQPEKYCSLAETDLNQRRLNLRQHLLPHVVSCHCSAKVLTIQFNTESMPKSVLENFVEQERKCCGFLDFTITTHASALTVQITAPTGSETLLTIFAENLK